MSKRRNKRTIGELKQALNENRITVNEIIDAAGIEKTNQFRQGLSPDQKFTILMFTIGCVSFLLFFYILFRQ